MENGKTEPVIKLSENVRETITQDGAVLLDIEQGLCFSMNPVGARIWEMLKQGYPPGGNCGRFGKKNLKESLGVSLKGRKRFSERTASEPSSVYGRVAPQEEEFDSRLLLRRKWS